MWIAGDPSNGTLMAVGGEMPAWAWVVVVGLIAFSLFPRDR